MNENEDNMSGGKPGIAAVNQLTIRLSISDSGVGWN
jgi:hypothetical protein